MQKTNAKTRTNSKVEESKNNSDEKSLLPTPIYSDSPIAISGIKHVTEFIQFVNWFATPGQFREPENQKEFAEQIGVAQDTLTDWKKHPKFWPLVYSSMSQWIKEKIPDAIGGLYNNIMEKGSAGAVELFLRLGGINNQNNKKSKKSKN